MMKIHQIRVDMPPSIAIAGCGISLYSKEKTQELVPLAEKGKLNL